MSIIKKRLLVYLALIITILISVNLFKNIIRLIKADDRLETAKKELDRARNEEKQLKQQISLGGNSSDQEKEIRDTLKMARPNEVVVIIPEEVKASLPSGVPRPQDVEMNGSNFSQWLRIFGF